ncbi:DUF3105 domain-containing protein [Deinococcus sp. HMF7604]|uniref:DUF3105 domain-containing protein n=1 Tax=Deinococcus betulae TaxID=2873312 RepID=UPI001CCEEA2A|nr:DUF3105 domain-containing protein [Deinococcus betulae]MBZ9752879.1 DUF3105 domain-containing protein [Deinococcus betulae]
MKRLMLLSLTVFLAACNQTGGDIEGVQSFKFEGGAHKSGRLEYAQRPPAGGEHNAAWQNCGIYDRPLYDEYAVHSMEHGAVWISYQPGLSASQVLQLKDSLAGRTYILLSPHESQKAPIVLSAWNKQLEVQDASDPRIKSFVQTYEQGGEAPEIGASCSGAYDDTV